MKLRQMILGGLGVVAVVMTLALAGCSGSADVLGRTVVTGSGNVISESRAVSGFTSVSLDGVGSLVIEQGAADALVIEADDNIVPYLKSEVEDQVLVLGFKDHTVAFTPNRGSRIVFHVTVRSLEGVGLSGAGKVNIGPLAGESLRVEGRGAGDIVLDSFEGSLLKVQVDGGAKVQVSGTVKTQQVEIDGAGDYNAEALRTGDSSISIDGAGSARVWAEQTLHVKITGAGAVRYKGSPTVTKDVTGVGTVGAIGS